MIPVNGLAKLLNLQEFAWDGGVIFNTLANNNESHADGVFILVLYCSI